jgi:hypothetical protein
MTRRVVWFSCGAASAVAAKLTLAKHPDAVIARVVIPSEHPDGDRFAAVCQKWFNSEIVNLKSDRYADTWDVWEKRRFLVGPKGALCTTELKKMVRHKFQRADDIQVFGYVSGEEHRAERFREQNFEVILETPLIASGLTKSDCLALIERAGIRLPAMYALGYENNNCIGCVKGGMGYWNKIRRDFPATFERMAKLERTIGRSVINEVFLDELDPRAGRYQDEPNIECSLLCHIAEQDMTPNPPEVPEVTE